MKPKYRIDTGTREQSQSLVTREIKQFCAQLAQTASNHEMCESQTRFTIKRWECLLVEVVVLRIKVVLFCFAKSFLF